MDLRMKDVSPFRDTGGFAWMNGTKTFFKSI